MRKSINSLPRQIEQQLIGELREMEQGTRIPSEAELAERFNVSRMTVREALSALEHKNLIVRKHGVGTFVNQQVLNIQTRLEMSFEFGELIRATGHEASLAEVQAWFGAPSPAVAEKLELSSEDEVVTFKKVFSANEVPVIYVINAVPLHLVNEEHRHLETASELRTYPIYRFLTECCQQTVNYQIAGLKAVLAADDVGRHLQAAGFSDLQEAMPLMNMEEVGYNADDVPVFYADEYYNTEIIHFQMLREPGQ